MRTDLTACMNMQELRTDTQKATPLGIAFWKNGSVRPVVRARESIPGHVFGATAGGL